MPWCAAAPSHVHPAHLSIESCQWLIETDATCKWGKEEADSGPRAPHRVPGAVRLRAVVASQALFQESYTYETVCVVRLYRDSSRQLLTAIAGTCETTCGHVPLLVHPNLKEPEFAAQDVLDRAAHAEGSTAVGRRYRGVSALRRINAQRCADAMARLAADPDFAMAHIEQGAVILVSCRSFLVVLAPNHTLTLSLTQTPAHAV